MGILDPPTKKNIFHGQFGGNYKMKAWIYNLRGFFFQLIFVHPAFDK